MRAKDALGRYGEDVAARHLAQAGVVVLERNWRCPAGEIDIVGREGGGPGHLRGEDPSRAGLRQSARGGDPGEGRPAAPAGRDVDRAPGRPPARGPVRRGGRPAGRAGRGAGRAPARGDHVSLARTRSVALVGVVGHVVEVEVDMGRGLPGLTLIGLPDTALSESRDRIRAAVLNSGEEWPTQRVTINLSPASLPKAGSGFDVALATCVLAAAGALPAGDIGDLVLVGELGLDGVVRPVRGVLPSVLAAARAGARRVVVPAANAGEAAVVPGIEVLPVRSLRGLVDLLRGDCRPGAGRAPVPARPGRGRARPRGGRRSRRRPMGARGGGRGRSPPAAARASRLRQDHARRAPARRAPRAVAGAGARGHRHPLGGGRAAAGRSAGDRPAVPGAPPHGVGGGDRGRGQRAGPARCGQPCAPGGAVPRRGPGVRQRGARRAAAAARVGPGGAAPLPWGRGVPRAVPAGARGQPLPVRLRVDGRRPGRSRCAPVRRCDSSATSAGCPDRWSTGSTCAPAWTRTALSVVGRRPRTRRRSAPGSWRPARRQRTGGRRTAGGATRTCPVRAAGPLRAAGPGGPAAGRRVAERRADGARRGPGVAGRLDGRRPGRARPAGSRERRAGPRLPRPEAA